MPFSLDGSASFTKSIFFEIYMHGSRRITCAPSPCPPVCVATVLLNSHGWSRSLAPLNGPELQENLGARDGCCSIADSDVDSHYGPAKERADP
jgi:hypothetical protein